MIDLEIVKVEENVILRVVCSMIDLRVSKIEGIIIPDKWKDEAGYDYETHVTGCLS